MAQAYPGGHGRLCGVTGGSTNECSTAPWLPPWPYCCRSESRVLRTQGSRTPTGRCWSVWWERDVVPVRQAPWSGSRIDEHAVDRGDCLVRVAAEKNAMDVLTKAGVNEEYMTAVPQ